MSTEKEEQAKRTSDRLRECGFESGQEVYEFYNCFSIEEAKASLFDTTYGDVKVVHLKDEERDADIPIVISRAEPRYEPFSTSSLPSDSSGCYSHPNWYFEGWVLPSGFNPYSDVVRVRIYVNGSETNPSLPIGETFTWQRIPEDPDPNDLITYAL